MCFECSSGIELLFTSLKAGTCIWFNSIGLCAVSFSAVFPNSLSLRKDYKTHLIFGLKIGSKPKPNLKGECIWSKRFGALSLVNSVWEEKQTISNRICVHQFPGRGGTHIHGGQVLQLTTLGSYFWANICTTISTCRIMHLYIHYPYSTRSQGSLDMPVLCGVRLSPTYWLHYFIVYRFVVLIVSEWGKHQMHYRMTESFSLLFYPSFTESDTDLYVQQ